MLLNKQDTGPPHWVQAARQGRGTPYPRASTSNPQLISQQDKESALGHYFFKISFQILEVF